MSGGRFQGAHGCLLGVRYRPISCVSVRSCSSRSVPLPACSPRVAVRLSARSSAPCVSSGRRCGGGRVACLPMLVGGCGAGDVVHLVPSRFSSVRYGERGGWGVEHPVLLAWRRGWRRCAAARACSLPCDCLPLPVGAAGADEMMRNGRGGGGSLFPMSHDFRFLSFLFPSPSRRSACLSRAGCGWIARIVCCSLFSVDCLGVIRYIISRALRWFLSAFLFLARCLYERLYFVALSLSPYPVFLSSGASRARAIFLSIYLLAYHVISIAHLMSCPFCGLLRALRLSCSDCPISSRPSPRLFDTGNGEIMAMRCLLAGGTTNCVILAWMEDGRCHLSHETMRMR